MSDKKANSSYASWALIMEGVSSARVEAYRLRHLLNRTLELVENSVAKDHLYQVGGDIILGFPQRLHHLEQTLDRTSFALAKMGESHLRERLPISDREKVDQSIERAAPLSPAMKRATQRVVWRYRHASRREFFDVLQKYYRGLAKNPKGKDTVLSLIKFWFLDSLAKIPPKDETWFARSQQIAGEAPPFRFEIKPTKPNKGYAGGYLSIGNGVSFEFEDHAVVRSVLRNVSLRQAMNVVRSHLQYLSNSPFDMERNSYFVRNFNKGIAASKEGIEVRFSLNGFRPYQRGANAFIPNRSVITIHTVIRNGQVERAGSVDLSEWFDPKIIGLDSWDDMDWNTVRDRAV